MLVAFSLALSAPVAHATQVTLGPPELHRTFSEWTCRSMFGCSTGYTIAEFDPSASNVAPAAGVVTAWGMEGDGAIRLRVLEPAPGGAWRAVGTSEAALNYEGDPNQTNLPIKAGDLIGADVRSGSDVRWAKSGESFFLAGSETYQWSEPPLDEGATATPASPQPGELELRAYVELTPVIASVSPDSGPTTGGGTVTITGKYLDSTVYVKFGSTLAEHFTVAPSGEYLIVTVPPSAAGTVDIHVAGIQTVSEVTAADQYTYVAPTGPTGTSTTSSFSSSGSSSSTGSSSPSGSEPKSSVALKASGFSESASTWRPGSALPHISRAPLGTTFSFTLNEPGSVALTFTHTVPGRRSGGKCVAPNASNQGRRKCERTVVAGSLADTGHAGLDKISFQGHLSSSEKLGVGTYHVSVTTHGSHGLESLTSPLSFTILP